MLSDTQKWLLELHLKVGLHHACKVLPLNFYIFIVTPLATLYWISWHWDSKGEWFKQLISILFVDCTGCFTFIAQLIRTQISYETKTSRGIFAYILMRTTFHNFAEEVTAWVLAGSSPCECSISSIQLYCKTQIHYCLPIFCSQNELTCFMVFLLSEMALYIWDYINILSTFLKLEIKVRIWKSLHSKQQTSSALWFSFLSLRV